MVSYQGLVDSLFEAFGTPVTLSDSRDRLIAFSAQPEHLTDAVRRNMELWVGCVAGALEEQEYRTLLAEAGLAFNP